jgi:RNA polymerase sigma-70 factor (ECF subfamily)
MTDETTLHKVRVGLCQLLPRLRRFARSLTGDPHDADDLVQVAIERALARAGQWNPSLSLKSWLFGIVRNAWIDETRSRRRGRRMFTAEEEGERVGVSSMDARMVAMSVEAAMNRLPEEQRAAIALVLIEGLSYKEAAAAMDIPIGTLTSRLSRGRDTLQNLLSDLAEDTR